MEVLESLARSYFTRGSLAQSKRKRVEMTAEERAPDGERPQVCQRLAETEGEGAITAREGKNGHPKMQRKRTKKLTMEEKLKADEKKAMMKELEEKWRIKRLEFHRKPTRKEPPEWYETWNGCRRKPVEVTKEPPPQQYKTRSKREAAILAAIRAEALGKVASMKYILPKPQKNRVKRWTFHDTFVGQPEEWQIQGPSSTPVRSRGRCKNVDLVDKREIVEDLPEINIFVGQPAECQIQSPSSTPIRSRDRCKNVDLVDKREIVEDAPEFVAVRSADGGFIPMQMIEQTIEEFDDLFEAEYH